ncbi:MAG: AMP-binding protein [Acidobacteriaceae bacterium]
MNNFTGLRTIPVFLDFHASSRPHETAVIAESDAGLSQSLTWQELQTLANRTANWMMAQGLHKGDAIVLHLPNSLDFYLLWLAGALSGVVTVPVDPRCTVAELAYIVDHSDARLVVTLDSTLGFARNACDKCGKRVRTVTGSLTQGFSESELGSAILSQGGSSPSRKPEPLDVVGMLYTSGTTGKPKGVMLTHAAYLHGAEVMARATALTQDQRHLISLPLHHAAAQCHAMIPSLVAGTSVAIVERFRPSQFIQNAIRHNATRAALFGAPLRMLLHHHADGVVPPNPLRLITFAQNLTVEEVATWEADFGIPLLQVWGMTEMAALPLVTPLHGPRNTSCLGLPVAGYDVKIVDDRGSEVVPGETGEIIVRVEPGWSAMSGYYKDSAATAELMRNGWLWTGDNALQDEKGEFHFVGRRKEMIKRSGENISPVEIEEALKTHPHVQDAAAVGVSDPVRDERVIAFVVLRPAKQCSPEDLRDWCRERLSAYKVPEEFLYRDEFPRTSVGKIQRHHLRDSYLRDREAAPEAKPAIPRKAV